MLCLDSMASGSTNTRNDRAIRIACPSPSANTRISLLPLYFPFPPLLVSMSYILLGFVLFQRFPWCCVWTLWPVVQLIPGMIGPSESHALPPSVNTRRSGLLPLYFPFPPLLVSMSYILLGFVLFQRFPRCCVWTLWPVVQLIPGMIGPSESHALPPQRTPEDPVCSPSLLSLPPSFGFHELHSSWFCFVSKVSLVLCLDSMASGSTNTRNDRAIRIACPSPSANTRRSSLLPLYFPFPPLLVSMSYILLGFVLFQRFPWCCVWTLWPVVQLIPKMIGPSELYFSPLSEH